VPALLPDDGREDGVPVSGGRYETVLRVVRAMCAHDQSLAAELGAAHARSATDPGAPAELPARVTMLAPPGTLGASATWRSRRCAI
jgi:hypothetical protein